MNSKPRDTPNGNGASNVVQRNSTTSDSRDSKHEVSGRIRDAKISKDKCYLLPALGVTMGTLGILLPYIISILVGHVKPEIVYISAVSHHPPECHIFALFTNISSGAFGCCIYLRYQQIKLWQIEKGCSKLLSGRIPRLSFNCGLLGCVGLVLLTSFQIYLFEIHLLTVFIAFANLLLYCAFETYNTYKMLPAMNTNIKYLARLRLFISVLGLVSGILFPLFGLRDLQYFKEMNTFRPYEIKTMFEVLSVIGEWITVLSYYMFTLTLIPEFKLITLKEPSVKSISGHEGAKKNGGK